MLFSEKFGIIYINKGKSLCYHSFWRYIMLKLIIGVKGTGKTKQLIANVNEAIETSSGAVVCLEKGTKLRFDIKPQVRLINTNDYCVFDAQALYGFVAGILASNHDITDLFIDGTLKICGDISAFENMCVELDELSEKHGVKIGLESMGKIMLNGEKHLSFFGCSGDIQRQLELLNSPCATVCVDTGHTNEAHFLGAPSPADMIRALGKNVTVLHLHDNNGTADLHLPPICDRRGCVNWPDVFDALDEVGYSGVYNFELLWNCFGGILEDTVRFRGKFLRYLIENKGRIY